MIASIRTYEQLSKSKRTRLNTTRFVAQPPLIMTVQCSAEVQAEYKMWLCVLLQAVFEQDAKLAASTLANRSSLANTVRLAQEYVQSADFEHVCSLVGIKPSYLRAMTPARAHDAYTKLRDGRLTKADKEAEQDDQDMSDVWQGV